MTRRLVAFAFAAVLACQSGARAQAPAQPPPASAYAPRSAVTRHSVRIDGVEVAYAAHVDELVLDDAEGAAGIGTAIAYVREDAGGAATRPLVFLFNGGPGASSSNLHLALGPRTVVTGAGGVQAIADNPASLLAAADLVFLDPVGTGYSRPLPGREGAPFWGVEGDARSVAQMIRAEVARLGRAASPRYLVGESYGGMRAAQILHLAPDLAFAGVALISPALDFSGTAAEPGNDLPHILTLPTFAAVAWRNGVGAREAGSAEDAFAAAERFAQGDYALALLRGDALATATRGRVAARISDLTGVPRATVLEHDLRIDVESFRRAVLAPRGLIVGRLDGRITAPLPAYANAKPPADDPSMIEQGRPSAKAALDRYLRTELAFPAPAETYRTLALDVNGKWSWAGEDPFYLNAAPLIGEAMRRDPKLRVYAAGALFDLATPLGATTYALNHAGAPAGRLRVARFEAGHMLYEAPTNLARLRADLLALVAPPAAGAGR